VLFDPISADAPHHRTVNVLMLIVHEDFPLRFDDKVAARHYTNNLSCQAGLKNVVFESVAPCPFSDVEELASKSGFTPVVFQIFQAIP